MDLQAVQARVAALLPPGDPETFHQLEDQLMKEFIRALARGEVASPVCCANALLPLIDLDHTRWYS